MASEGPLGPVEASPEDEACLGFYASVYDSTEEEVGYFTRFAHRIEELGHEDAAALLWDLTQQWEVGYWETEPGEEAPELAMSAQLAEAGDMLGAEGHVRCVDLGEVWDIEGYRGEPDPAELMERQRGIWMANRVDGYRLLVVVVPDSGIDLTQYHVEVVDGEVGRLFDAETGGPVDTGAVDAPLTVDEVYELMEREGPPATSYDLVNAVPRSVGAIHVRFDLDTFPEPFVEYEGEEMLGEEP